MPYGPIELIVIAFPGNQFSGEIAPAMAELVEGGLIRVIDVIFIAKDVDGNVTEFELSDLGDDVYSAFDPIVADLAGLLTHDDAQRLAGALEPDSSAGIMLFENTWATRFANAVVNANGQVVLNERIPREVIDALIASQSGSAE